MLFLSNAPFDRFFLTMHPSDQIFLKASILRGPSAGGGGMRAVSAQGYVDKEPFVSSTLSAMDFSNAGTTEPAGDAFRAHVQYRCAKGANRNIYGPRRPDEDAAKDDLESMRAAARGMSREDVTGGGALRTGMFWRKGAWTRPLSPYPFQTLP